MRTWADWDDARPGFVEIDLVSHDGGNTAGPFAFTLAVTDIATGWTENRSVPSKAATCVFRALKDIAEKMPFSILGWTPTTGRNSSTATCWNGAKRTKSPSLARGRGTRTTVATSSRRTGRWSAPWLVITATTPPQNCCCSTRSGSCSPS